MIIYLLYKKFKKLFICNFLKYLITLLLLIKSIFKIQKLIVLHFF